MPTASIQWHCRHCGTVRLHAPGSEGSYIDMADYSWAATVVMHDADTVEFCGIDKPLSREDWTALADAILAEGFTKLLHRRAGREPRIIDARRWASNGQVRNVI